MNSYKRTWIILGLSTLTACNQGKNRHGFIFLPNSQSVKKEMQHWDSQERLKIIKKNARAFSACVTDEDKEGYTWIKKTIDSSKLRDLTLLGQEELLAHEWVYNGTLTNSIQLKLLDGCHYDIVPIKTENPGIFGFILTSTNQKSPRMRVVFRGTKCSYSARRDLEFLSYGGAGAGSFSAEKSSVIDQIRGQLIAYQNRGAKQVALTLSGHSLGGADAQHAMHAILQEIAHQENKREGFAALDAIKLYHFNSTGVPQEIADECNRYVKTRHKNRLNMKIESHSMLVHGDPIQCTGEANLFDEVSPNKVKSKLYKFKKGVMSYMDLLRIRPHREKFLIKNSKQEEDSCSIFSNDSLEDSKEITKELRTKSSFLNYISSLFKSPHPSDR